MIRNAYLILSITMFASGVIALSAQDEMRLANAACSIPENAVVMSTDPVKVSRAAVAAAKAKIKPPPVHLAMAGAK